jgi:tRNA modification GTPase
MSLLKAESLHRMIQAPSFSQFQSSYQQFSSAVPHPLFSFQQKYLDLLAILFMILDHPELEESDSEVLSRTSFLALFDNLEAQAKSLISDYRKNRRIHQGFTVLIAGYNSWNNEGSCRRQTFILHRRCYLA